jgi:hypothetical protein
VRSAVLLLAGFGLLVAGVAVACAVDGGLLPGIAMAVLGLVLKGVGFLLGDPAYSTTPSTQRRPQTLAGRSVERPRAGIPVGRTTAVRRRVAVRPARVPSTVVRPLPVAPREDAAPARRHRRAS